jgi:hypothetical protein
MEIVQYLKKPLNTICIIYSGIFILINLFGTKILEYGENVRTEKLISFFDYIRIIINLYNDNKLVSWVIFIALLIILYVLNIRKKLDLLIINSFENVKYSFNLLTKIKYNIVEHKKDLSNNFKISSKDIDEIKNIIVIQDDYISEYNKQSGNNSLNAFFGILQTPLLLRAGYQCGDENKFYIFHKYRSKNSEKIKILGKKNSNIELSIVSKSIKANSKELLVSISSTFEINDNTLQRFNLLEMNFIKFKTDSLGFDVINSINQINKYKRYILEEIRKIMDETEIEKIHFVISSSSAFTFALGQSLSKQYFPEIINYHFDGHKYTWGISIFEYGNNAFIY